MMTAESASAQKETDSPRRETTAASPELALNGSFGQLTSGWLGHDVMSQPANAGVRTLAMRRAQQTHGNHYAQRMVSRMAAGSVPARAVQRQCACGGTCAGCRAGANTTPDMAKTPIEEHRLIQTKFADPSSSSATRFQADQVIPSGDGVPLDASTRQFMEPRFGANLGDVRVHTDSEAAASATALNANAYTTGRDIYFAAGKYAPSNSEGRHLIAHEITHTIQQAKGAGPAGGALRSHSDLVVGPVNDPLEIEAERAAGEIMRMPTNALNERSQSPVAVQRFSAAGVSVQRDAWDDFTSGVTNVASDAKQAAGQAWDATKQVAQGAGQVAGQAWDATKEAASDAKHTAGDAWDKTKHAAGQAWDTTGQALGDAKQAASGAVDWLTTAAGNLAIKGANALAKKFGGTVTRSPSGGIDITIRDLMLSGAHSDTHILSLGLPTETLFDAGFEVGTFVINTWVGTVYGDPTGTISVGPVRLQNIKLHLDPFGSTYSGSADLTSGAGVSGSVEKAHEARVQAIGVIPIEPPIPIEAKAAVGIRTVVRAIGKGALKESVVLGYSGGNFLFRANTDLKFGALLEIDHEAFLTIEIETEEVCSLIWPISSHRLGSGAVELSVPYTYGSGPGGSISKFGKLTAAPIPIDDIKSALQNGHAPAHCLSLEELGKFLCDKGKIPKDVCSGLFPPGLSPSTLPGTLPVTPPGPGPITPPGPGPSPFGTVPKCAMTAKATPRGRLTPSKGKHAGKEIQYGQPNGKHTKVADCSVPNLIEATKTDPAKLAGELQKFVTACQGHVLAYGSQLGDEGFRIYAELMKEALENGDPDLGFRTSASLQIGLILGRKDCSPTATYEVIDDPGQFHLFPVNK